MRYVVEIIRTVVVRVEANTERDAIFKACMARGELEELDPVWHRGADLRCEFRVTQDDPPLTGNRK